MLLHGIARSNSGCSFLCSAPRPSLTGDIFIVQHADHLFNQMDVFELRKAHDEIARPLKSAHLRRPFCVALFLYLLPAYFSSSKSILELDFLFAGFSGICATYCTLSGSYWLSALLTCCYKHQINSISRY